MAKPKFKLIDCGIRQPDDFYEPWEYRMPHSHDAILRPIKVTMSARTTIYEVRHDGCRKCREENPNDTVELSHQQIMKRNRGRRTACSEYKSYRQRHARGKEYGIRQLFLRIPPPEYARNLPRGWMPR